MTPSKDIIRMAREAGLLAEGEVWVSPRQEAMERFAALVAAAEQKKWHDQSIVDIHEAVLDEREACAALVDANAMACTSPIYRSLLQSNADAIRARGQA